ncbi:MAG: sigma-70 family RNA polymerase sigma factor [Saprospirales bacterium]|nr:sigma-70 family RNA polymerase sigma factor [Saprospirales bacterium]MBK8491317.1 sigma-70 family RNA polymerase sigma factor [Saprospirales bacterium]
MTSNSPAHPDHRFIEALLANDDGLIREIYDRYSRETIQWIARNKGNADDARDIFQEALIAITLRARKRSFVLTCSFGAYFFLVVRGKWYNELRKRSQRMVTSQPWEGLIEKGEDIEKLAEETLLEHQREMLFQEKLRQLPERCRELLQLSWKGSKMEEVARQMGVTYAYARKKKSECIASLVASIQDAKEFIQLF